jgi:hypothetical protein
MNSRTSATTLASLGSGWSGGEKTDNDNSAALLLFSSLSFSLVLACSKWDAGSCSKWDAAASSLWDAAVGTAVAGLSISGSLTSARRGSSALAWMPRSVNLRMKLCSIVSQRIRCSLISLTIARCAVALARPLAFATSSSVARTVSDPLARSISASRTTLSLERTSLRRRT